MQMLQTTAGPTTAAGVKAVSDDAITSFVGADTINFTANKYGAGLRYNLDFALTKSRKEVGQLQYI